MGTLLDLKIRFEPDFVEYKYEISGSQPREIIQWE